MFTRMSVKFCIVSGMFLTFFQCLLMNEQLSFVASVILALVSFCLISAIILHRFMKLDEWILKYQGRAKGSPFQKRTHVWVEMNASSHDSDGCSHAEGTLSQEVALKSCSFYLWTWQALQATWVLVPSCPPRWVHVRRRERCGVCTCLWITGVVRCAVFRTTLSIMHVTCVSQS